MRITSNYGAIKQRIYSLYVKQYDFNPAVPDLPIFLLG